MPNTLRPPPEVIESFPKPNYINPETHGPGLMITACMLSTIAIFVVGARLYARFHITKAPGIDDFLIVLALVFGIATSILIMVGNQIYYSGYHVWDIPPGDAVPHRINVWVAQLCYTIALTCVKISVLLFYRRLSVSFTRTFLIAVWVGIIYNAIYCLSFILTLCLIYRPLQAYWLSFDPVFFANAHWSAGAEEIATPLSGLFSLIGDFYSTVLPLILVSGLCLPRRQKWALYALFSLGFAVVIFGSFRTYFIWRMINKDWDFTWTLWKVWLMGEWEMWFAVYAASAPALKPFFKQFFERMGSSKRDSTTRRPVTYVVRGDSQGKLGKVEKMFNRQSAAVPDDRSYFELTSDRTSKDTKPSIKVAGNHIVKQVEYDVERCDSIEEVPAWQSKWYSSSVNSSVVSGSGR